jgi:hypothetical protein
VSAPEESTELEPQALHVAPHWPYVVHQLGMHLIWATVLVTVAWKVLGR